MSKNAKQKWSLDRADVSYGQWGSSSGKTGQFERKLKKTSSTIFLTHTPTGIRVEGEVPPGNYSKKEMQKKRGELKESLFLKLENMVAEHLGISGR
jgi:protein subunit release factor A